MTLWSLLKFPLQLIAIILLLLSYISWWHITSEWEKYLETLNFYKYSRDLRLFVKANPSFPLFLTVSILPLLFYYRVLRSSWQITHNWWDSEVAPAYFFERPSLAFWQVALSDRLQVVFLIDEMSLLFSILTVIIVSLIISLCWFYQPTKKRLLCLLLVLIEYSLLGVFSSHDFLSFFFFFELTLLPMFILIFSYGTGLNRLKAAYWLIIFTLISSVLLILAISLIYIKTGLINFSEVHDYFNQSDVARRNLGFLLCFILFISFSVKVPLMPLHIWLPEVHVEAPTTGSMVLASLLLKLGGYGILRICCGVFPLAFQELILYIIPILLLSFILSGLIALIQLDAKKLIAYSSISHMSVSLLGICYLSSYGYIGAVISMFAHGFTSPALFFLVGGLYDRYHTRNTLYFGGLSRVMPIFSIFLFFFTLSNIAFPGFMNFIGEINIFLGITTINFFPISFVYIFFLLGVLLVTAYSLTLFNRLCWGNINWAYLKKTSDLTFVEFTLLTSLLFLLIFFGLEPEFLLEVAEAPRTIILR